MISEIKRLLDEQHEAVAAAIEASNTPSPPPTTARSKSVSKLRKKHLHGGTAGS